MIETVVSASYVCDACGVVEIQEGKRKTYGSRFKDYEQPTKPVSWTEKQKMRSSDEIDADAEPFYYHYCDKCVAIAKEKADEYLQPSGAAHGKGARSNKVKEAKDLLYS